MGTEISAKELKAIALQEKAMQAAESVPMQYTLKGLRNFLEGFIGGPQIIENEGMRAYFKLLGPDFFHVNIDENSQARINLKPIGWSLRRVLRKLE